MSATKQKRLNLLRRAHRTRAKVRGTSERPRLSVYRSLRHISAQIIDDSTGKTLAFANDVKIDRKGKKPVEIAAAVGAELAKTAKAAGIAVIVFDRGGYKYHGRVKALADAAREGGLEF